MFTRVDDRLHDHPKFLKCSLSARGLWVTALSWVGDKLTDGFVPHSCLGRLGARKRDADRLVEAGLWEQGECDGEPGYWFHDFEDWNKAATHDEVRKRAGQNRSRVLKHRTRRSVVYKQRTPQPTVTGTTPADWSTPEDPRCRDHAKLPREHVPAVEHVVRPGSGSPSRLWRRSRRVTTLLLRVNIAMIEDWRPPKTPPGMTCSFDAPTVVRCRSSLHPSRLCITRRLPRCGPGLIGNTPLSSQH